MKQSTDIEYKEQLWEEHRHLTSLVLQAVQVEMIYLLGTVYTHRRTESIFSKAVTCSQAASHYYILVLINPEEAANKNRVQDRIENNLQHHIPTTVIVLELDKFTKWVEEGHPFVGNVCRSANLLYNAKGYCFSDGRKIDEETLNNENEKSLFHARGKVQEFIAGAELYIVRKNYKMAAFMLHQATEQSLLAVFAICTGLTLSSHNLDKLLRYCCLCLLQLQELFPREKEKNKLIFSLLQRAYIDSRYSNNYTIDYTDLLVIMEKISAVKELLYSTHLQAR